MDMKNIKTITIPDDFYDKDYARFLYENSLPDFEIYMESVYMAYVERLGL